MYVREYLEFVAGVHQLKGEAAHKRIEAMIDETGLGIEAHKKIGALSKGYRQRVGLAQAMMHDPQVLILDEPRQGEDRAAQHPHHAGGGSHLRTRHYY